MTATNCNETTQKYFRVNKLPHIWCPGCGHGTLMNTVVRAIEKLGLNKDSYNTWQSLGICNRN